MTVALEDLRTDHAEGGRRLRDSQPPTSTGPPPQPSGRRVRLASAPRLPLLSPCPPGSHSRPRMSFRGWRARAGGSRCP